MTSPFCQVMTYCLAILPQDCMIPHETLHQESKPNYIIFSKFLLISLSSHLMTNMKVLSMVFLLTIVLRTPVS